MVLLHQMRDTNVISLSAALSGCEKEGDVCKQLFCLVVKPA